MAAAASVAASGVASGAVFCAGLAGTLILALVSSVLVEKLLLLYRHTRISSKTEAVNIGRTANTVSTS